MRIITISEKCIKLIEEFECSGNVKKILTAYQCPAKVWTIGVGTTVYPNGQKVGPGDVITLEEAYEFLRHDLRLTMQRVDTYCTPILTQAQFDALVSFVYNIGSQAFKGSTLLKILNANPADEQIDAEFLRWNKVDGKPSAGLTRRRKAESHLYFSGELKYA